MNKYYVYIYLDPEKPGNYKFGDMVFEYEPIWVGKGSGNRYKISQHLSKKNNQTLRNRIKDESLKKLIVMRIAEKLSEEEAYQLESYCIKVIGRLDLKTGSLFNESNGGKGNSGYKHSEKRKQKISKAMKGKSAGEKSHRSKLTAEQVEEIRKLRTDYSISKLAVMFNVSTYCIWAILKRINWK